MAIPIPPRPSGFTLGDPAALAKIDAFVDIQCPHSKQAWPTLAALQEHYKGQSVSLTVHLITLSNHRQSWDMGLGLFALAEGDAEKFFNFATFLYQRQDDFYNGPFKHKTHADLIELVTDFAHQHAQVDRVAFQLKMASSEIYEQGRTPIRYSATRAVWGTPTFLINNADNVPVNHHSTVADWVAVIDKLL